ncbi:MAG TPA: DNA-processing protein DprA [Solirubrobacterales bacterium]|nr:DNA-processing protein DprA [Solirubrobacterales bacterium]
MTNPHACPGCLRRSWLLAVLGPQIERAAIGVGGRRAVALLRLTDEELAETVAPVGGHRILADLAAHPQGWFARRLADAGCWATCRHEDACPGGLRDPEEPPAALIGNGDPAAVAGLAPAATATIVGSRRADSYGREVARDLGADLAAAGVTVVSGLAFGIDACAHRGALDGGGPTIAVLGCGPDTAYPAAHRGLWGRIAESGAVVSELPPGSVPWRWSFPARSRVLAALAGMTVVVAAAERSGSLVTAELAADLGREVGAVPGPVISRQGAGPNTLLAEGACVVRDARDVVDALAGVGMEPGVGGA